MNNGTRRRRPLANAAGIAALATGLGVGLPLPRLAAEERIDPLMEALKPLHAGSRVLAKGDLVVEVMDPAAADGYYRGVRFTPLAAVIRAERGGREYFLHEAERDPLAAVAGLFAEFDLTSSPPGFAEAAIGEGFVKVGVGVLTKTERNYRFWPHHPVLRRATTETQWSASTATFRQVCEPHNGHGYELEATLALADDGVIEVDWRLHNSGSKSLATEQYVHNCFQFDGRPVGPDYELSFPYDFEARGLQAQQRQEGRAILFPETLTQAVNIVVEPPADYAGPNTLLVRHLGTGQTIECLTSKPGRRTAVHASKVYLCPEQFIAIRLEPGESTTWTRRYVLGWSARP